MSRIYEWSALAAIAATMWSLCGGLARAEPRLTGELTHHLGWITAEIHEKGLRRRVDVVIEIDASEVAAGFSRPDCDGLLLIAPLPQTAQGLGRIAPRLDLSGFTVRYTYDGAWYRNVPRLQRLRDRLMAELRPAVAADLPRLIAVAEASTCDLFARAEATLREVSRGGDYSSQSAENRWGRVGS